MRLPPCFCAGWSSHHTPKRASWLNMAEIEIDILSASVLEKKRLRDRATCMSDVAAWQQRRNAEHDCIAWSFTRQDADRKLGRH